MIYSYLQCVPNPVLQCGMQGGKELICSGYYHLIAGIHAGFNMFGECRCQCQWLTLTVYINTIYRLLWQYQYMHKAHQRINFVSCMSVLGDHKGMTDSLVEHLTGVKEI